MGTYVKGMETPTWCGECDFLSGLIIPDDEYHCCAPINDTNYSINVTDNVENWSKPDWCPLVEVSEPHGSLIDGDELKTAFPKCDNNMDVKIASVQATINHMSVIIEAEGE